MTSVPHSGAKSVTPGGSVAGGGHTKGEWSLDVVPSGGAFGAAAGRAYGVSAKNAGGYRVPVVVWRGIAKAASAEGQANARLISAAPDAFGLAVDFIQWVDEFTGTLPEPQSDALFDLYRRARRIYLTVDPKGHDASRADLITKATAGETRNAEGAL